MLASVSAQASISDSSEPLLVVEKLRVEFPRASGLFAQTARPFVAVDDVTFSVKAGHTLGIVGESGSGKTTLGRAILRLIEPTSGKVYFGGREVNNANGQELLKLRRSMQIVFQDPGSSLNPRLSIGATLCEPLLVHGLVKDEAAAITRVSSLLERCGMPATAADKYPHEFSGGQRQRLGIARALSVEPKLIVCDEPTSALDVSVQAQILNLLKDLQRDMGLAYLFISHDMSVIDHMCDDIAVMRSGKIVEMGTREEVLRSSREQYTQELLRAVPGRVA